LFAQDAAADVVLPFTSLAVPSPSAVYKRQKLEHVRNLDVIYLLSIILARHKKYQKDRNTAALLYLCIGNK